MKRDRYCNLLQELATQRTTDAKKFHHTVGCLLRLHSVDPFVSALVVPSDGDRVTTDRDKCDRLMSEFFEKHFAYPTRLL